LLTAALLTATATLLLALALLTFTFLFLAIPLLATLLSWTSGLTRFVWVTLCFHVYLSLVLLVNLAHPL
jgi:hypothetical protein